MLKIENFFFCSKQIMKKYYCHICELILDNLVCPSCEQHYRKADLDQRYQYFLHIPIKNQLIDFLHSPLYYATTPARGTFFQDLLNRGAVSLNDLSL